MRRDQQACFYIKNKMAMSIQLTLVDRVDQRSLWG